MKKMNLKFFGRGAKMVLPLFLLLGIFMVSATSVSAQFVPKEEAGQLVGAFISQMPTHGVYAGMDLTNPSNPKVAKVKQDILKRDFGQMLLRQIKEDNDVALAIENTYKRMAVKIPASTMDPIKQAYVELLSE